MSTTDAIDPESVDAIVTDPAYPRKYLTCFEHLSRRALEWLKPGGSLLVMSGHSYLPQVFAALEKSGMVYRWTFCALMSNKNAQIFDRHIIPKWKPVLWYTKGGCDHLPWCGDLIDADARDKRFHRWGQSVRQMEWLVRLATVPGQIILDPFCGGGTTGVAALQLQRMFIGVDIDQTAIAQTASRLDDLHSKSSAHVLYYIRNVA
jgi:DNA modification methylase